MPVVIPPPITTKAMKNVRKLLNAPLRIFSYDNLMTRASIDASRWFRDALPSASFPTSSSSSDSFCRSLFVVTFFLRFLLLPSS